MEEKNNVNVLKIIKRVIIGILIICAIALYARFAAPSALIVNEYPIKTTSLSENIDGLKIVHFSDLHYGSTVTLKEVKKIVKKINTEKPDIVVFTGDLIEDGYQLSTNDASNLKNELRKIDAQVEIMAVKGNHDFDHDYFDSISEELNWRVLNNTYHYVYYKNDTPIVFVGLDDLLRGEPDYNNAFSFLNETQENNYTIVLAHEPDQIEQIKNYNFNLFLAGHSHLGQIRLPLIGAIYTPVGSKKYHDAHYKVNNADMYISGGLGTSVVKARLFNPPSINLYRFYTK